MSDLDATAEIDLDETADDDLDLDSDGEPESGEDDDIEIEEGEARESGTGDAEAPDSPGAPVPPTFSSDWSASGKREEKDEAMDEGPPAPPPAGLNSSPAKPQVAQQMSAPPRKVLTVDEDLADWIQEYLQYRGFTTTLDCFQAEYLSRQYSDSASRASSMSTGSATGSEESRETIVLRSRRATMNKILDAFDVGDAERFAKLWETNIPLYVRREDARVQKAYFWRVCILSHVQ